MGPRNATTRRSDEELFDLHRRIFPQLVPRLNLGNAANGQIVRAEGEARFTPLASGQRREDDRTDAAVLRLTEECARHLACPALVDADLDANPQIAQGDSLLQAGFPLARGMSRVDLAAQKVSRKLMKIVGWRSADASYSAVGVDPTTHVAITFDQERAIDDGRRVTAPNVNGMSGCGVWTLNGLVTEETQATREIEGKMVAIFTEHPRRSGTLVATRIGQHLDLIVQHFD